MPDAPPFPLHVLPAALARLAREAGVVFGCDPGLIAVPALAAAAALIGRSVWLDLGLDGLVGANLFVACVPPRGTDAAEAIAIALRPLRMIDEAVDKSDREMIEDWVRSGRLLPHRRLRVLELGLSVEALGRCIGLNGSGFLGAYDELPPPLFGASGRSQVKDQRTLRKLWAGAEWVMPAGTEPGNESPLVSLVGAVSLDAFPAQARARADALDRWLWVCPDRVTRATTGERTSTAVAESTLEAWAELATSLIWAPSADGEDDEDNDGRDVVGLSADALASFRRRANEHAERAEDPMFPDTLRGTHAALEVYAGRLCLILGALRNAEEQPDEALSADLGPEVVEAAWDVVDYFGAQAERAGVRLRTAGRDAMPDGARWILTWMRRNPDATVISERDLTRCYAPSRGYSRLDLGAGFAWLARRSALRRIPVSSRSGGPGRTPSATWEIHPDLDREAAFC
jgi:hypothetical protein